MATGNTQRAAKTGAAALAIALMMPSAMLMFMAGKLAQARHDRAAVKKAEDEAAEASMLAAIAAALAKSAGKERGKNGQG